MSTEHFTQFFPTICAGFGLFLVGLTNLLLLQRGLGVRIAATLLALCFAVWAASATGYAGAVSGTLKILAVVLVTCVCLSSRRLVLGVLALQRPTVMFAVLTTLGIGTAIGAVVLFEMADEKATANSLDGLELSNDPASAIISKTTATTDLGTTVALKEPAPTQQDRDWVASEEKILASVQLSDQVIRRGSGGEYANCHGWVFSGGKFRLAPADVELILNENGYHEVQDPRPSDVVVYHQHGSIAHTAIVRYVTEGQPVMVEGKWGALGILLHPVDKSIYGTAFTYYRSNRTGHLLVGIDGHTQPTHNIQRTVATE
ncbi:MAG: hypothetical protein K8U57_31655 [Planctomycetes bacterium]|nr:hypothetical protein [Planctomycetota bacterium]